MRRKYAITKLHEIIRHFWPSYRIEPIKPAVHAAPSTETAVFQDYLGKTNPRKIFSTYQTLELYSWGWQDRMRRQVWLPQSSAHCKRNNWAYLTQKKFLSMSLYLNRVLWFQNGVTRFAYAITSVFSFKRHAYFINTVKVLRMRRKVKLNLLDLFFTFLQLAGPNIQQI